MYHSLYNIKIEILKHYFNELCKVEAEPVKIVAVTNLLRFKMK